jgi:hypothetical protein
LPNLDKPAESSVISLLMQAHAHRKESSNGDKECMRNGPVLPQTAELDSGELEKVLDPMHEVHRRKG